MELSHGRATSVRAFLHDVVDDPALVQLPDRCRGFQGSEFSWDRFGSNCTRKQCFSKEKGLFT